MASVEVLARMGQHIPERTCVACGTKRPQKAMLRLAASAGAEPVLDVSGRAPGRGAYVCREESCVETAFKRRALERALKLTCGLSPSLKDVLRGALKRDEHNDQGV